MNAGPIFSALDSAPCVALISSHRAGPGSTVENIPRAQKRDAALPSFLAEVGSTALRRSMVHDQAARASACCGGAR